jgi:hypothetical protein
MILSAALLPPISTTNASNGLFRKVYLSISPQAVSTALPAKRAGRSNTNLTQLARDLTEPHLPSELQVKEVTRQSLFHKD